MLRSRFVTDGLFICQHYLSLKILNSFYSDIKKKFNLIKKLNVIIFFKKLQQYQYSLNILNYSMFLRIQFPRIINEYETLCRLGLHVWKIYIQRRKISTKYLGLRQTNVNYQESPTLCPHRRLFVPQTSGIRLAIITYLWHAITTLHRFYSR